MRSASTVAATIVLLGLVAGPCYAQVDCGDALADLDSLVRQATALPGRLTELVPLCASFCAQTPESGCNDFAESVIWLLDQQDFSRPVNEWVLWTSENLSLDVLDQCLQGLTTCNGNDPSAFDEPGCRDNCRSAAEGCRAAGSGVRHPVQAKLLLYEEAAVVYDVNAGSCTA